MHNYFLYMIFSLFLCNTALNAQETSHPLQGEIWHVSAQKFITEKEMMRKIKHSRYILLGGRHGNKDHHLLQARLIKMLSRQGRPISLSLEMVERHKQNAFAIFQQNQQIKAQKNSGPWPGPVSPANADGLEILLNWNKSGWPRWAVYKPLFDAAIQNDFSLWAANFSRHEVGKMHQDGLEALPEDLKADLRPLLRQPLTKEQQAALEKNIAQAHCHMLPQNNLHRFADIERARHAAFALSMIKGIQADHMQAGGSATALLIASNDHLHRNRAVPYFLRKLDPQGKNASLAIMALSTDKKHATDYIQKSNAEHRPYDYIWFTSEKRNDPCAGLE